MQAEEVEPISSAMAGSESVPEELFRVDGLLGLSITSAVQKGTSQDARETLEERGDLLWQQVLYLWMAAYLKEQTAEQSSLPHLNTQIESLKATSDKAHATMCRIEDEETAPGLTLKEACDIFRSFPEDVQKMQQAFQENQEAVIAAMNGFMDEQDIDETMTDVPFCDIDDDSIAVFEQYCAAASQELSPLHRAIEAEMTQLTLTGVSPDDRFPTAVAHVLRRAGEKLLELEARSQTPGNANTAEEVEIMDTTSHVTRHIGRGRPIDNPSQISESEVHSDTAGLDLIMNDVSNLSISEKPTQTLGAASDAQWRPKPHTLPMD